MPNVLVRERFGRGLAFEREMDPFEAFNIDFCHMYDVCVASILL